MMDNKFKFNKTDKIILYGAAYLGKLFFDTLSQQGFQIEAFIDNRADEISDMKGRPVFKLDEMRQHYEGEDVVVIVAVKNVFEHSKIAFALADKGFNKIIYKPYEVIKGKGTSEQEKLSEVFDVIQDNKDIGEWELELTGKKAYLSISKKYLIEEKETEVLVYLPTSYICQDKLMDNNEVDICAMYMYPHIQFFEFLQGKQDATPDAYLEFCKKAAKKVGDFETTTLWEQNVVRNRTLIFEEMSNSFLIDRDFFVRSAPRVEWNEQGYFNLNSGKHRTTFLISKGVTCIPVRMKKADYVYWLNRECAKESFDKIASEVLELKAPIEHPYFYEYPCTGKSFYENVLYQLARCFCKMWYTEPNVNFMVEKKMYIGVDDNGFLSRHFRRMGCCVYNEQRNRFTKILDELFMIKNKDIEEISKQNDVAIVELDDIESFYKKKNNIYAKNWIIISKDDRFESIEHGIYIAGGACNGVSMKLYYIAER